MKKILSMAVFCCLIVGMASAQTIYKVNQSDYDAVEVAFHAAPLQVTGVELLGETFTALHMEGFISQSQVGRPALPALVKLVEIPLGEGLTYDILSLHCDTLDGASLQVKYDLLPAQPSRSKSDNSPVRLVKEASAYQGNQFVGEEMIVLQQIGVARDANLAEVHFNPVKWNPETNQLIVVKDITLRIRQAQPDVAATRAMKQLHHSAAFSLSSDVINSLSTKDVSECAPLRYLIVAHSSFRDKFDSFVTWKKRQGFKVDVAYTDDANVGSDTAHISAYIKSQYTNATADNPAPTFVLLIGDVAQIPAYACGSSSYWSSSVDHYSDLYYMTWTNGDVIPDCYYGRFSVQTVDQLNTVVNKTLLYEQYAFTDPSYLSKGVLIAGEDGGYTSDNAYKYADPAMDYIAKSYVNAEHGFNTVYYYKNNTSFAPTGVTVTGSSQQSSTATTLRSLYNQGIGWINYSAHGDVDEWSIPSFTTTHVASMSNNGMPSIMIGNCCLSNSFDQSECFGEALLRKGNNAGAVAYFGGSDYTYWVEDFYWSVGVRSNISNTMNANYDANNLGMYDRLFHTHNEAFAEQKITTGGITMAGNLAVQSSTTTRKQYYWEVYHLMGDPSLLPWLGQAAQMSPTVTPSTLFVGSSTLSVSAVPNAYVALTNANHELVSAVFADATGNAQLNFTAISTPGDYELSITAQNYQPYFVTLPAIVNDGPFLMLDTIHLSNAAVAGDSISFYFHVNNIGTEPVSSFSIEAIANSAHLFTLEGGQDTIHTTIAADASTSVSNMGTSLVWNNVADQTTTQVEFIVRWGSHANEMSRRTVQFSIAAPKMEVTHYTHGTLTADSTISLNVTNRNVGHAAAEDLHASLVCIDPCITVTNTTAQSSALLNENCNWNTTYSLALGSNLPESGTVQLFQIIEYNGTRHTDTLGLVFGSPANEDFESNGFTNLNWQNNSSYAWVIDQSSSNAHTGSYCAKSGNANQSSSQSVLTLSWTSTVDDSISFWHKVSSESNYDHFRFYIDDTQMEESSGPSNPWTRSAYAVSAGTHTFKFAYEKDYSVNNGSDCAWIDDLTLPISGTVRTYTFDTLCEGERYEFCDSTIVNLPAGTYLFQHNGDNTVHFLQLVVSEAPTITIEASATQVRSGEPVVLQAHGGDRYLWSTGETVDIIRSYPRETTSYMVRGWSNGCSTTADITITVSGSVSIETTSNTQVRLFPNPFADHVTIQAEGMRSVTLFNVQGQQMMTATANSDQVSLDLHHQPSGIYILRIVMNDGREVMQKLIKK